MPITLDQLSAYLTPVTPVGVGAQLAMQGAAGFREGMAMRDRRNAEARDRMSREQELRFRAEEAAANRAHQLARDEAGRAFETSQRQEDFARADALSRQKAWQDFVDAARAGDPESIEVAGSKLRASGFDVQVDQPQAQPPIPRMQLDAPGAFQMDPSQGLFGRPAQEQLMAPPGLGTMPFVPEEAPRRTVRATAPTGESYSLDLDTLREGRMDQLGGMLDTNHLMPEEEQAIRQAAFIQASQIPGLSPIDQANYANKLAEQMIQRQFEARQSALDRSAANARASMMANRPPDMGDISVQMDRGYNRMEKIGKQLFIPEYNEVFQSADKGLKTIARIRSGKLSKEEMGVLVKDLQAFVARAQNGAGVLSNQDFRVAEGEKDLLQRASDFFQRHTAGTLSEESIRSFENSLKNMRDVTKSELQKRRAKAKGIADTEPVPPVRSGMVQALDAMEGGADLESGTPDDVVRDILGE